MYDVQSLQSRMILTMSHWSSGLTCLLPATMVTGSNPLRGLFPQVYGAAATVFNLAVQIACLSLTPLQARRFHSYRTSV
jgi:hypothetical protein